MDHRRTPSRNVFVPSSWFLVMTVLACVGAAGWLGWLLVDGDGGDKYAATAPTSEATTPAPTATTAESSPTPTPTPTPKPAPTVSIARDGIAVSVLNNTGNAGVAGTFSGKVTAAGWTVGGIGNWRGSVEGNSVYYPPGRQPEAKLLATDVGITRILPAVSPMRMDRLTIILSGPQ